jgi:hypothetical protein
MKFPAGGLGMFPQHVSGEPEDPVARSAQAKAPIWLQHCDHPPALTWAKRPLGGSDCPNELFPQQMIVPALLRPQLKWLPTVTRVNLSAVAAGAGAVLA